MKITRQPEFTSGQVLPVEGGAAAVVDGKERGSCSIRKGSRMLKKAEAGERVNEDEDDDEDEDEKENEEENEI